MLTTKFQVNCPFVSGEEAKNRFSRWWPSWISNRTNFSYFSSTGQCFLLSFKSIGLLVQEKKWKIDFQDGRHGFLFGTILAIFDLQVTLMLPTVSSQLAFWFRKRSENRISRWPPRRLSLISDSESFLMFFLLLLLLLFFIYKSPRGSYQVLSQLAFWFRIGSKNRLSRWQPWRPSWNFDRNDFSYFWSTSHPDASYHVSSQFAEGVGGVGS